MSDGPNMLVVSPEADGRELCRRLGNGDAVCLPDPFDALLEMGRRTWSAVLVAAPQPELDGFCRAARRLQKHARLLAVCTPAAEPDTRELKGRLLDDYFIHPPSSADLGAIRRAASGAGGACGSPLAWMADLIAAARSVEALEGAVAALASERLGCECEWVDACDIPAGRTPLLLAAGDAPRALVAEEGREAGDCGCLSDLQGVLPALMDAARRAETLHHLAVTDHLTGLCNRRYFYHLTDRILDRTRQEGGRATLLLFDLDNFKHYNDTYSYATGDAILRETASLVKKVTRSHDVVARLGGDEFAVLFWEPDEPRSPGSRPPDEAAILADRFRREVQTHEFPSLGPRAIGSLTISGGLARFPRDGANCRELLRAADKALKGPKRGGKNAIQLVGRD